MCDFAMCDCSRRYFLQYAGAGIAACVGPPGGAFASPRAGAFMDTAFAMKAKALAAGDQAYGAVLVLENAIIGWGPSRVVGDENPDAHAERVAMWDAQKRRGQKDLSAAMLYSTSVPCRDCQDYAARYGVAKRIHGRAMRDAGRPLRYHK